MALKLALCSTSVGSLPMIRAKMAAITTPPIPRPALPAVLMERLSSTFLLSRRPLRFMMFQV